MKSVTTSVAVAVWLNEPLVPVIVKVYEPAGVVLPVVTVSEDEPVAGFGLNAPVAPVGNPLTLKLTGALNPPTGVMFTL